ncbi:MAG: imidazole glycerol phosphate synthase subunit HisH [Clostridiales bacterium]|nr:imidazole glycerol phosphate synthase subunit HisH [Clostridiales bacterium]
MIGIIDYGMGNLRSVEKALQFLSFEVKVIKTPEEAQWCEKLILPGVGAFGDAIAAIREAGLDNAIYEAVGRGVPFLGICLGMQLMFDLSQENGLFEGLKLLPGRIVRIKAASHEYKIPHMGWNSLDILKQAPLFDNVPQGAYVYFDHAYHLKTNEDIVSACSEYGIAMQVAAQRGNLYGLQFHPEKSGEIGLRILANFGGLS